MSCEGGHAHHDEGDKKVRELATLVAKVGSTSSLLLKLNRSLGKSAGKNRCDIEDRDPACRRYHRISRRFSLSVRV